MFITIALYGIYKNYGRRIQLFGQKMQKSHNYANLILRQNMYTIGHCDI